MSDKRIRELEDLVLLWQGRAQTVRQFYTKAERDSVAATQIVNLLLQREPDLLPPGLIDNISSCVSDLLGEKISLNVCPCCYAIKFMKEGFRCAGYTICPKCAGKPEHWQDGWGTRWGRDEEGKFVGVLTIGYSETYTAKEKEAPGTPNKSCPHCEGRGYYYVQKASDEGVSRMDCECISAEDAEEIEEDTNEPTE